MNMSEGKVCLNSHTCIEDATRSESSHAAEVSKGNAVSVANIEASSCAYAHVHLIFYLVFCPKTDNGQQTKDSGQESTRGYCCANPSLFSLPRHTCALVIIQMK